VYGVADRIEFVVGDFLRLAPSLQADVVFLSPPWGGPQYLNVDAYDIETIMQPVGGTQLHKISLGITENIAYYVPRNINTDQASGAVMGIHVHVSEIKYGQMDEDSFIQF
jgi:trimethylguanosine synthase